LGPQVGNLVVDRSEANLHADCVPSPKQVEAGPVSHNEADGTSTRGWEIVQRRKVQRKPSTPRPSTESPHTELRSAQGASHRPQGDCLLPPPTPVPSITSAPASVLAGSRGNKGKSVVVSGASGHSSSCSKGLAPRKGAQQRSDGVPNRGEGLLPTPSHS